MALKLDPLLSSVAEELDEANIIYRRMLEARKKQKEVVRTSVDKQESEVARCFYNLAMRGQVG